MGRLLIVDDEEAIAFAAGRYFQTRGFDVDIAVAQGEAEQLLSSHTYDVLVADLRLGQEGDEGFRVIEFARRLRPAIRVILVTAYASSDVEARARELGVDSMLKKPATLARLAEALAALVGVPVAGQGGS